LISLFPTKHISFTLLNRYYWIGEKEGEGPPTPWNRTPGKIKGKEVEKIKVREEIKTRSCQN
jgi:hypothetical protein